MKKLGYLSMIVMAMFAFQSCSNNAKDSTETADSLNQVKDTTSNVAETGGIAVTEDDAKFATQAATGGMAEVELSKLALSKSTNTKVKEFATMMVSDHGKVNEEMHSLATSKNITLPTTLDSDNQKVYNDLNALSGVDFDKKYVNMMIDDHQKTLDLLEKQAKDGIDVDLKAFAAKTSATVRTHLNLIKKIKDEM